MWIIKQYFFDLSYDFTYIGNTFLMLCIGDITYNDISYKMNEFNITYVLSTVISGVICM